MSSKISPPPYATEKEKCADLALFILVQSGRDDPVGDLAQDLASDIRQAIRNGELPMKVAERVMTSIRHHGCREAAEALDECLKAWHKLRRRAES